MTVFFIDLCLEKDFQFPARISIFVCLNFEALLFHRMSDEELIDRILEGDEEAFGALLERYHVKVINVCLGILHNRSDAEDAAQEVFIQVFQSIDGFRRQSALSTWIYRIAVNKSINHLRKSRNRANILTVDPAGGFGDISGQYPAAGKTPADILLTNEMRRTIRRAMDSLPEKQRVAFALHKYEDLSYKEIAETMGLSLPAVESLIHRAKKNLQKKLTRFQKE